MPYFRWNDHSAHVMSLLGKLYKNSELTDCALDTNGGLVHCHKTLLIACSPYLKKLIMDNQGMMIIPLKEVRYTDMKLILDFVYFGVVDISLSDVPSAIETARLLQIPYLSDFPSTISEKTPKKIGRKSNIHHSIATKIDTANECSENVQDTLPPFSFVAVSPFSGNSEHSDDEHNAFCGTPTDVENPSEINSNSGDTTKEIKMERDFESESEGKNDTGEEDNVNETDDVYESMELKYISHKMGDNEIKNTENIFGNESTQNVGFVSSKGCFGKRMENIKMEFESICDVAKFELSEVKPLETSSDNDSVGDNNDQLSSNETASKESSTLLIHFDGSLEQASCTRKEGVRRSHDYGSELKLVSCNICHQSFHRWDILKKHMLIHASKKVFMCEICGATFSTKGCLKKHEQIHYGNVPLKCGTCAATFSSNSALKRHMQCHTGYKPFQCDICEARFARKWILQGHVRCHTGDKPFKCDICEASFSQRCNLKTHKLIHTRIKPLKCDICGAKFCLKGSLKKHERIHTGYEPFKCETCAATFCTNGTLKRHMLSHTGYKPFQCDICEARFSRKSILQVHVRCHTGDKPFKCDICAAQFSRNHHLEKHKRVHA